MTEYSKMPKTTTHQKSNEIEKIDEDFQCPECQSSTRSDIIRMSLFGTKGMVLIEDVPALVCEQCGEQYYDEETISKLNKLTAYDYPSEMAVGEIVVPVFSLTKVTASEKEIPKGFEYQGDENNPLDDPDEGL